jgi:hypothetical protein
MSTQTELNVIHKEAERRYIMYMIYLENLEIEEYYHEENLKYRATAYGCHCECYCLGVCTPECNCKGVNKYIIPARREKK